MQKVAFVVAFIFAAGLAAAANQKAAAKAPATKTHVVACEFVSADTAAGTITVKDDKGQTSTAPAKGKALAMLSKLKPGEKLSVTCQDNAKGEHQAIVAIAPAKAPKKS